MTSALKGASFTFSVVVHIGYVEASSHHRVCKISKISNTSPPQSTRYSCNDAKHCFFRPWIGIELPKLDGFLLSPNFFLLSSSWAHFIALCSVPEPWWPTWTWWASALLSPAAPASSPPSPGSRCACPSRETPPPSSTCRRSQTRGCYVRRMRWQK